MNSRQYQSQQNKSLAEALDQAGIAEYVSVTLSADRTTYSVTMPDYSIRTIPSELEYFED